MTDEPQMNDEEILAAIAALDQYAVVETDPGGRYTTYNGPQRLVVQVLTALHSRVVELESKDLMASARNRSPE